MPSLVEQTRKRPVNQTLNEALVAAQAKAYTSKLSATIWCPSSGLCCN